MGWKIFLLLLLCILPVEVSFKVILLFEKTEKKRDKIFMLERGVNTGRYKKTIAYFKGQIN